MVPAEVKSLSVLIKEHAHFLGFDLIGIAPSRNLSEHKSNLQSWLESRMNADMIFLGRNLDLRLDPGLFFPGAKSVIVTGMNYFPSEIQGRNNAPVISKYAYGDDYHNVIKKKLKELLDFIISTEPSASGKTCVDSSPILEKAWASEAGLGWTGKNSLLINRDKGSFIFLGEIILNIGLEYDNSYAEEDCKSCNLCINACPTGAINANRTIDAGKCISWLTVENKNEIPARFKGELENRIFGCDICQDVCPWNKGLDSHNNERFRLNEEIAKMTRTDWETLDNDKFETLFERSPLRHTGFNKISGNIRFVTG